jgi:hypothetical protein
VVPEEYFDAIAALLPHAPQPAPQPLVAPTGLPDFNGQQGQYLVQYHQQQQGQYLGQYYHQQQHEPCFGVDPLLPPPASLGLLSEVAADTPLDNLNMPMAEFMEMFNEQPAVMANEEPAEMGKEQPTETGEGEPTWESLGSIVDDDEFASFNGEG